ncbi:hypothetical protein HN385_06470 [archaeon]|jgi:hypothetical protein|nr:hypothetical protein [archaeon]MBT3451029.1 hypothetical protein [archaeon]MBT6869527.1 hypothetical protein [archaeon]MBT7193692.1 hypothetical protein [archaeon]MBT7380383.1 hypothetical protein [archaeon]
MFSKSGDRNRLKNSFNYPSNIFSNHFFHNLKSKKGQVTVFIILGIIILLAVALVILLRTELLNVESLDGLFISEKGKVASYVSDCVLNVGEEALTLAGLQGGYVEVPERYSGDVNWNIPMSSFLYIPLWAYGSEIDQPSIEEIKIQVDDFIEENVRECLIGQVAFNETYDMVEISSIESDTEFNDKETKFDIHWELLVQDKSGELVAELINHEADSPVRFKVMYEMADAVLDSEMANLKIEDLTQDLIALEHENVPVMGMELSCNKKTWQVNEVEQTLKDMLRINLRNLKIEGTDYEKFSDDYPYYQNHYVWDVDYTDDDLSAVFKYEDTFPFTFEVGPRQGNVMRSDALGGNDYLSFLCIQSWKFTYDVVYPVVLELRDEKSGAIFQMAFSSNLIQNFPYKGQVKARESSSIVVASEDEYCHESPSNVPMNVQTYSYIENNFTGVYVKEPLENVNVSYTCIKYKCEIGSSEYDYEQMGDVAGLSAEFPYCPAAIMRGNKDLYTEDWEYVVSEENKIVELYLRPLTRFYLNDVDVVKHQIEPRDCSDEELASGKQLCFEITDAEVLDDDETAMVTLKYYPRNLVEEVIESSTNITGNGTSSDGSSESVSEESSSMLSFEDYFTSGDILHESDFIISSDFESEDLEESYFELLAGAEFTYDILAYLVDEDELIGGYRGEWVTPYFDPGTNSYNLVFHVLEIDPNDDEYYYEFLSEMALYSDVLPTPEFE